MAEQYSPYNVGVFASGAIQSKANKSLCIGWKNKREIKLFQCDKNLTHPTYYQNFVLSWHRHIKMNDNRDDCLTKWQGIEISSCHFEFGNQFWFHDLVSVA